MSRDLAELNARLDKILERAPRPWTAAVRVGLLDSVAQLAFALLLWALGLDVLSALRWAVLALFVVSAATSVRVIAGSLALAVVRGDR